MWLVLGGKLRNPGFELRAWADCAGNRAQDCYVKRVLMVGGSGRTIELTGGRGGPYGLFSQSCFLEAARVQKDQAGPHPDSQKGTAAYTGAQFQQNRKT